MDLSEGDWKKLGKEVLAGGTRTEALARFGFLYGKYGPLFTKCKDKLGEMCEFIALDDVRGQLASEAPKVTDQGIKNIRAIRGMDAPKQAEIRVNPFLDERPLGPAED